MYVHKRSTRKRYAKSNAKDVKTKCTLCQDLAPELLIESTTHCNVVRNRVAYDTWEHHNVLEHYMVVPKRHVTSMQEMTDEELLDQARLCAKYEIAGYNVYARAVDSPRRSVAHQHTHLIRIASDVAKAGLYLKRPYINVSL